MSDDELIPRNFQLAREASMTTANLLRTLLIPNHCFPRCDITYFRVAQSFFGRPCISICFWFIDSCSLVTGVDGLVVDDLLKGRMIWLVVVFSALVYLSFGF